MTSALTSPQLTAASSSAPKARTMRRPSLPDRTTFGIPRVAPLVFHHVPKNGEISKLPSTGETGSGLGRSCMRRYCIMVVPPLWFVVFACCSRSDRDRVGQLSPAAKDLTRQVQRHFVPSHQTKLAQYLR